MEWIELFARIKVYESICGFAFIAILIVCWLVMWISEYIDNHRS